MKTNNKKIFQNSAIFFSALLINGLFIDAGHAAQSSAACTSDEAQSVLSLLEATMAHNDYSKSPQPEWIQRRIATYEGQLAALGCSTGATSTGSGSTTGSTSTSTAGTASCSGDEAQSVLSLLEATMAHNDYSKSPQPEWIQRRIATYESQLAALGCSTGATSTGSGSTTGSTSTSTAGTASVSGGAGSGKKLAYNSTQLSDFLKTAKCGDTIVVQPGKYDQPIKADATCTSAKPLVIESTGRAKISNVVDLFGAGIVIRGFDFSGPDGRINLRGDDQKIVNNRFTGWAGMAVFLARGSNAEVAYNEFHNPAEWGLSTDDSYPLRIGVRSSHREDEFHRGAHIHHNYFHDFPAKPSKNYHSGQSDAIEVCFTGTLLESGFLIEDNLINRHLGGNGIVDIKCSNATVKNNTVINSPKGRIDLRYGANSVLMNNWIENSGGTVIRGGYHKVIGNVYINTNQSLAVAAGNDKWNATGGQAEPQAYNVLLSGNKVDFLTIGKDYGSMPLPAIGTVVYKYANEKIYYETQKSTTIKGGTRKDANDARKIGESEVGIKGFANAR